MKTVLVSALVGASLLLTATLPARADALTEALDHYTILSAATIACVEHRAMTQLSPGQVMYLEALVDKTWPNATEARKAAGLTASQAISVHTFLWTAPTNCALAG